MTTEKTTHVVVLRYFAWLREKTGVSEERLTLAPGIATVAELLRWQASRGHPFDAAFAKPEAVRVALQAQLPSTPVEVRPLSVQVNSTIVQERMLATVASGFGVLALVLSSVGLYGLLAYSVAQRSREIGIRMALGATAAGVILVVLLRGARLVAAGVALGYPAVWLASRAVASMLFGLKPADPSTVVGAIALLASSALVASYVPARRASRIDPLRALSCE